MIQSNEWNQSFWELDFLHAKSHIRALTFSLHSLWFGARALTVTHGSLPTTHLSSSIILSGNSKAKELTPVQLDFPLLCMSHCIPGGPAWLIAAQPLESVYCLSNNILFFRISLGGICDQSDIRGHRQVCFHSGDALSAPGVLTKINKTQKYSNY